MKKSNKLYGVGCIALVLGGSGMAEVITSNRGSFLISAIVFSIGLAFIMESYRF